MSTLTVAVLGLGEAGGRLAEDLVEAGANVRGFDPVASDVAVSVRARDTAEAVAGSDVVLSVNSARVARAVLDEALTALFPGALYADLNSAAPAVERDLAARAESAGMRFVDVGLLGPIPTRGLHAPALASGGGAQAFADLFGPLGMPVTVISQHAGDAAALKLVRSVFMKGIAAAALESVDAAEALGYGDWARAEMAGVVGEQLLERLLEGSRRHAARRTDEIEAACDVLRELGVEPRIAAATASLLADLAAMERAG